MQEQTIFSIKKLRHRVGPQMRHSIDQSKPRRQQYKSKTLKTIEKRLPQRSIYSLAVQSKILVSGIDLPDPVRINNKKERRSESQVLPNSSKDKQKNSFKINQQIKLHRFTKNELNHQKNQFDDDEIDQLKYRSNKEQVGLLRRIIDHYKIKSMERTYYSNLVNNLGIKINNGSDAKNRFITLKDKSPGQKHSINSTTYEPSFRINHLQQLESLDLEEMFKPPMKIQSQSINRFIKSQFAGNPNEELNISTMKGLRERLSNNRLRKEYNQTMFRTSKRYNQSKTDSKSSLLQTMDNCVTQKVNKYKEFLFLINFSHNIYRDMDVYKYDSTFKVFIGKGNNSSLIRSIMKNRFWFEEVKNTKEAHFVWTQLKQDAVFQKQNQLQQQENQLVNPQKLGTLASNILQPNQKATELARSSSICSQSSMLQKSLTLQTSAARSSKLNSSKKLPKQQHIKLNIRTVQSYHPNLKICTNGQLEQYNKLMHHFNQKKKVLFTERLKYMNNMKVIHEFDLARVMIHNHIPLNGLLGNKKAMFYMLRQFYRLINRNVFDCVPLTYHIRKGTNDPQYTQFNSTFVDNKHTNKPNYWIIKPGQFSNRGQGITCTQKIEDVRCRVDNLRRLGKNKSLIVQQYIMNPFLYNGRKFDIRTFMLVSTNNGILRAYWYQEGYVRTSSYVWRLQEITDPLVHLTNDAIQKHSDDYGKFQAGNKLAYSELQRYLDGLPRPHSKKSKFNFMGQIYPKIKQVAADAVKATFNFLDKDRKGNNFQIFGFDFMIDANFKPWLIEINTNPCLQLGCPVMQRIIPSMVENAFRIGLDPIFPPPLNYSSTYKYSIPENALNYNKFELIFDQGKEGNLLKELYKSSNILEEMDDYQEDKEVYEQDQEEEIHIE